MAQIIVLTNEAKKTLQGILFREINNSSDDREDIDILHEMYSDVTKTRR